MSESQIVLTVVIWYLYLLRIAASLAVLAMLFRATRNALPYLQLGDEKAKTGSKIGVS